MKFFTILSFLVSFFSVLLSASSNDNLNLNKIDELLAALELMASREELHEADMAAQFSAQFEAREKSAVEDEYYSLASQSDALNEDLKDDEFQIIGKWSNRSLKFVFPEIFRETYLSAAVLLFYGIDKHDRHYSIAMEYVGVCWHSDYKNFDPNSLKSPNEKQLFNNWGFDTNRSSFVRFCEYVRYHEMPETSPIHSESIFVLSARQKWKLQREALLDFAINEIVDRFNNIDVSHLQQQVIIDPTILDIVVEMVKEKVFEYFASIDSRIGNFTNKLQSIMVTVVADTCFFGNIEEGAIQQNIYDSLIAIILPVLDAIYNYDDPSKVIRDPDLRFPHFL